MAPRTSSPHPANPVSRRTASPCAVLVNPVRITDTAGLHRSIRRALAAEGWSEPLWLETTVDDAGGRQAALAVKAQVGVLFVCGGDGTVLAALAALTGSNVALAILPAGTGNVLALNLGLPADMTGCVRVATRGDRRRIDLGQVDGRPFAVACGIGLDALMLGVTPKRAKRHLGWAAYGASVVWHLSEPQFRVGISLDGAEPISREVHSVLVANVGRFPGGINLVPEATAFDGLLDVVLIAPRRLRDWVKLLATVVGRNPKGGRIETFHVRTVTVRSDGARPRELDGDSLPPGDELTVTVLASAVTVCVPSQVTGSTSQG